MKKRISAIMIICVILLSVTLTEAAVIPAPHLSFNGTAANCSAQAAEAGSYVSITLSLWQGNTELISWSASGYHFACIDETCDVEVGVTYTLKLNGTINGVAFPESSIRRTNYSPAK